MMYGVGVRKRSVKGLRVEWVLTRSRTAWRAASLRTAIPGATDPATFLPNSSLSWDLSVYPLSPSGLDWSDIHRAIDGRFYPLDRYLLIPQCFNQVAWLHTACASEVIGAAIVLPISTFRSVWKQSHSFVNIWNMISIFSFYLCQIFLDMTDTHGLEFGAEQLSLLAVLKTRIPRVQMRLCMQNAFTKTGLYTLVEVLIRCKQISVSVKTILSMLEVKSTGLWKWNLKFMHFLLFGCGV